MVTLPPARPARFDPTGRIVPFPTRALFDSRVKEIHTLILLFLSYQSEHAEGGWVALKQDELARFLGKQTRGAVSGPLGQLHVWGYIERDDHPDVHLARAEGGRPMRREKVYRIRYDADLSSLPAEVRRTPSNREPQHFQTTVPDSSRLALVGGPMNLGDSTSNPRDSSSTLVESSGNLVESLGVIDESGGFDSEVRLYTSNTSDIVCIKTLEAEDQEKETASGQLGNMALADGAEPRSERTGGMAAGPALVQAFLAVHARVFPEARLPDQSRLLADADRFADQLVLPVAEVVFEIVLERCKRRGDRNATSLKVIGRTWEMLVNSTFANDAAQARAFFADVDAGLELFRGAYPAAPDDNLHSDEVRRQYLAALAKGATGTELEAAAHAYAARIDDRRYARRAAKWLANGEWREMGLPLASARRVSPVPAVADTPWARVRARLAAELTVTQIERWFDPLTVAGEGEGTIVVEAPTAFDARYVKQNLALAIERACRAEYPGFSTLDVRSRAA